MLTYFNHTQITFTMILYFYKFSIDICTIMIVILTKSQTFKSSHIYILLFPSLSPISKSFHSIDRSWLLKSKWPIQNMFVFSYTYTKNSSTVFVDNFSTISEYFLFPHCDHRISRAFDGCETIRNAFRASAFIAIDEFLAIFRFFLLRFRVYC